MKIAVDGMGSSLTNEGRAYVEYRMFSAMSRFGSSCSRLSIRLEDGGTTRMKAQYRCSAVLHLFPAGRIQLRSSGDRLYGTIDTVAERLARQVERLLAKQSIAAGSASAERRERKQEKKTAKERDHRGRGRGPDSGRRRDEA